MPATQAPQKKKRTKGGRYSHEITKEEIELYYHLPCEEASRQLGIGLTILKRICRRLGIDKWPYRQLKRAGKLGEGAAANAAAVASGAVPARCAAEQPAAPGKLAPRKRAAAKKKAAVSTWEPRDQSTAADDSSSQAGATSSGSEGSWHAGYRGEPADPAWEGAESAEPAVLPPAGAPGRRRSTDGGRPARKARSASPPTTSGSTGVTASGGSASLASGSGLQRAPSGGLKRIREEEEPEGSAAAADPLMSLLNCTADVDVAALSPFSAADECFWTSPAAEEAGPSELAANMSRLAMKSMSLKRQCSRDGVGLDGLDAALMMETPVPQGVARASSTPSRREAAGSPPLPLSRRPARGAPQAGWLAEEQHRLQPPFASQQQQQQQQSQQQQQQHFGEPLHEPDMLVPFPPIGDTNMSSLLLVSSAPRHLPSASEGCMMPAHEAMAAAGVVPLHHCISSGVLLDCADTGAGLLHHSSSSGSAHPRSAIAGLERDDSFLVGPAAVVTAVGPLAGADDGAGDALPSPFSMPGPKGDEDREGTGVMQHLLAHGGVDLPLDASADLMPLLARMAHDPNPAKQLMAGQLMQLQAAQASRRGAAEEQQQQQRRMAAAVGAGAGGGWAGTLSPREALSPGEGDLSQAVQYHQQVAQQYLAQRQEVQAMLAQRGGSQQLGALSGDAERLHQLARLKQLKQQLAAAQARQQELRRQSEQLALARAAAGRAAPQQQASLDSDITSAFGSGAAPRLGPPPPLPLHGAAAQQRAAVDGSAASLAAMLQQWRADAAWSPLSPGTEQRMGRASSAPLWETPVDWPATA